MNYIIRRLDPIADAELLDEAWHWGDTAPRWWRDCDKVFGGYPEREISDSRIHVGMFSDELRAVIHIDLVAKKTIEGHIAVKRGTPLDSLVSPLTTVLAQTFAQGIDSAFVWLPAINSAIFRLCLAAGFEHDGVVMFKGETHNKPIEWKRLSIVNH